MKKIILSAFLLVFTIQSATADSFWGNPTSKVWGGSTNSSKASDKSRSARDANKSSEEPKSSWSATTKTSKKTSNAWGSSTKTVVKKSKTLPAAESEIATEESDTTTEPVQATSDVVKNATVVATPKDAPKYYGTGLCASDKYTCVKIKGGQSWQNLFPNEEQRDLVQRINRTDSYLWAGKVIAIPKDISTANMLDSGPFPKQIEKSSNKLIIVDQDKLAWGAYGRDGLLVKWGPISSGKDYCPDVGRSCRTITGVYYVFNKKDKKCRSAIFPVGRGGSEMPHCMFFYKGYALHGALEVPGYRASHGCIRLFPRDAEWLNKEFVELSSEENGYMGTKVVVEQLTTKTKRK